MSKQRNEHWDSTSELNHNSALVWIKFYLSDSTATSTRSAAKREVDVQVLNHELGTGLVLLDLERNGGEGISFLGSGVKGHEAEGKWLELKFSALSSSSVSKDKKGGINYQIPMGHGSTLQA